jgi:hypothetical protein
VYISITRNTRYLPLIESNVCLLSSVDNKANEFSIIHSFIRGVEVSVWHVVLKLFVIIIYHSSNHF